MQAIKIHHLYVNPQNIKQSYRWKLRRPAMLLTLPSVWTVNTDSYMVENVFGTCFWMSHKNTNLLLWEIKDDMRLSTAKGSESTKCRTEISEGKKGGILRASLLWWGPHLQSSCLASAGYLRDHREKCWAAVTAWRTPAFPAGLAQACVRTAFPGTGVLLSSLTALLLQALQVVCEQPHSPRAVLARGWTLISSFSLFPACASFDGIIFSSY